MVHYLFSVRKNTLQFVGPFWIRRTPSWWSIPIHYMKLFQKVLKSLSVLKPIWMWFRRIAWASKLIKASTTTLCHQLTATTTTTTATTPPQGSCFGHVFWWLFRGRLFQKILWSSKILSYQFFLELANWIGLKELKSTVAILEEIRVRKGSSCFF